MLQRIGKEYIKWRLLFKLYQKEIAVIRFNEIEGEARIRKGVRQDYTLSHIIFNVYIQEAIDMIREKTQLGKKFNATEIDTNDSQMI